MKTRKSIAQIVIMFFAIFYSASLVSQDSIVVDENEDKHVPIKIKLNESGKKFINLLFWNQIQTGFNDFGGDNQKSFINMRRLRMMAFGQFSPKFLYMLHIGTHSINSEGASPSGKGTSDIFINDAWGEFMILDKTFYLGTGIHYWGAISRMQRSGTFKFLTMDNANFRSWMSSGLSGQFAREYGFYAKGTIDRLQYAVSANDALNNFVASSGTKLNESTAAYGGAYILDKVNSGFARYNYSARLEYNFWQIEGDKLPFKAGSSFSTTGNIFNVGAGTKFHPNSSIQLKSNSNIKTISELVNAYTTLDEVKTQVNFESAVSFAADAFLDKNGLTAYLLYQNTNYGTNFTKTSNYGSLFTGDNITALVGYVVKDPSDGIGVQPYAAINYLAPRGTGIDIKTGTEIKFGVNLLQLGNKLKTTIEFQSNTLPVTGTAEQKTLNNLMLQMQFVL